MPAPPADARSFTGSVTAVEACGADGALLRVRPHRELPPIRASRFFMLRREDGTSPLIPRPFSIYRQPDGELEFLIKVMGRGTAALADSRPGQEVRVVGPLGNGWPTLDGDGAPWVMMAGGIGIAPFLLGVEQALAGMDGATPARPEDLSLLFGAATSGLLYDLERFERTGIRVFAATDDGSAGFHGNVLQLLREKRASGELPERIRILACGPEPMLEAIAEEALAHDLECWLSLETLMGCGVGICNGCPVPTRPEGPRGDWPNLKCCVEGPVFRADVVDLARELPPNS